MRSIGDSAVIRSLHILDEDSQEGALDLVFLRQDKSIGTLNATVSLSAADAREVVGIVKFVAADYVALGPNASIAQKNNLDLYFEAYVTEQTIHVAGISRDTKTYTASGLRLYIVVEHFKQ